MTSCLLGFGALATGVVARRPDGVVVDLSHLGGAYRRTSLNAVLALGPREWARMRQAVDGAPAADPALRPLLPVRPGDYVDFYACEHHVTAMGRRFRPEQPPLPPAWRHVPLGYHGRTSTVVVSGEPVLRPSGVLAGEPFGWGPTQRLDVEVELAFVVGTGTPRGRPVAAAGAEERIFGAVVLNDWSARDIQAFESVPLGPHLGKSFCTTISPWVVPLDLLPRAPLAGTGTDLAPHLRDDRDDAGLDLDLVLSVDGTVVSRTNARHLSWSPAQLYAALTSNGASVRPGDLFATGTISGPEAAGGGSLLELGLSFLANGQTATVESPQLGRATGTVVGTCRPAEREAQRLAGAAVQQGRGPAGAALREEPPPGVPVQQGRGPTVAALQQGAGVREEPRPGAAVQQGRRPSGGAMREGRGPTGAAPSAEDGAFGRAPDEGGASIGRLERVDVDLGVPAEGEGQGPSPAEREGAPCPTT